MQYTFTSKTSKSKSPCVSLISYAYSLEIRFTLLCVFWCLQKVSSKITFLQSIFAAFQVVLGHFWLYGEFDDRYTKKPVSVTKTSVTIIIKAFITAYNSILQLRIWLQKFIKNGHIQTKNENCMTQCFFAGTIKP